MYLGQIVEIADVEALFSEPAHPYTEVLLAAVPRIDGQPRSVTAYAGEVPSPLDPPPGCRFHPRCPHAFDRCRHEVPGDLPTTTGSARCFLRG